MDFYEFIPMEDWAGVSKPKVIPFGKLRSYYYAMVISTQPVWICGAATNCDTKISSTENLIDSESQGGQSISQCIWEE